MTFAAVSSFVVGDDPGMARWLLEHWYEHIEFSQALQALGANIPSYPIQQMWDKQAWLGGHQRMHQAEWAAIGGGVASDLSLLDWENESQVYDWLNLHASIHANERESLGL